MISGTHSKALNKIDRHLVKGEEEGSDLWREFWEKEGGKSESPLTAK